LLLADACCGAPAFDAGFREMAARLFPDAKLEPIRPTTTCQREADGTGADDREAADNPAKPGGRRRLPRGSPALEAGRWMGGGRGCTAKYEPGGVPWRGTSRARPGHTRDSALQIATARCYIAEAVIAVV